MTSITRRKMIQTGVALALPTGVMAGGVDVSGENVSGVSRDPMAVEHSNPPPQHARNKEGVKIQYLEIVTPEMDALCRQYSKIYGVEFSKPNLSFGNARTARLESGGMIGIRKPMRDSETPVVRPYLLVENIKTAVAAAVETGGKVAMAPMAIPEHGMFAIVIHGGIECGFWQN